MGCWPGGWGPDPEAAWEKPETAGLPASGRLTPGETPRPEGGGRAPGETEGLSLGPSCFFQEPGGIPQPAQDSEAGGTADREPARQGAGVTRSRQGGHSDRNRGPSLSEVAGRGGNSGSWEKESQGGERPEMLRRSGRRWTPRAEASGPPREKKERDRGPEEEGENMREQDKPYERQM